MKIADADRVKERQLCEKYKKENSQLKKELRKVNRILVEVSNLVQQISVIRSFAPSQKNSTDRKGRLPNHKLPSKRLSHHRLRTHRLSSSLIHFGSSIGSFESFIPMEISSVQASEHLSTMNSSFVVSNLANENEVCIDHNPVCGWVSPTDSDGASDIYLTPKSSVRSTEEPLLFYDANDSYDADAEMSAVLMHGDKQINQTDVHDDANPLLSQSQSVTESMDFSIQSPCYVTQQSSDVFSNFSEILNNETNNNVVPLPHFHHLKVHQQMALQNSPILPNAPIAAADLSVDIGSKSPLHQTQHVISSLQHSDVVVTQNMAQCQNESSLSIGERSQFEYQSDESHVQGEDHLMPTANAAVIENAPNLFPNYPNTFGSSLNTFGVINYRSPTTNEIRDVSILIAGTHHQPSDDNATEPVLVVGNDSTISRYEDSIGGDLLELAKDLSSSSSMFEDSIESELVSQYENVFNTLYMQQAVDYFAQENACEFSIAEYLPHDLIHSEQLENSCSCCLCQLREKNGCTLDVCIRKHPNAVRCQHLQTRNSVCDACMDSMVSISKKTKTKHYQCIDSSCQEVFKPMSSLRNHYLKHLKCKMYFCNFCSKSYNTIRALRTHERSHVNK